MSDFNFTLGPDIWYPRWDQKVTEQKPIDVTDIAFDKLLQVEFKVERGSVWGWLVCAIACSNYSDGFTYDWFKDNCSCQGDWLPTIWRHK